MTSLLRVKDCDDRSTSITNSQIIQIDSYHQSHHINYADEADSMYNFLKDVCSDKMFDEINKRFKLQD